MSKIGIDMSYVSKWAQTGFGVGPVVLVLLLLAFDLFSFWKLELMYNIISMQGI